MKIHNLFAAKEKLEIVKVRGEAAQILVDWPSPPQAAKCVRTILKIKHQVNLLTKTILGVK